MENDVEPRSNTSKKKKKVDDTKIVELFTSGIL